MHLVCIIQLSGTMCFLAFFPNWISIDAAGSNGWRKAVVHISWFSHQLIQLSYHDGRYIHAVHFYEFSSPTCEQWVRFSNFLMDLKIGIQGKQEQSGSDARSFIVDFSLGERLWILLSENEKIPVKIYNGKNSWAPKVCNYSCPAQ